MVNSLTLLISHVLLALAAWRLVLRVDLDCDPAAEDTDGGAGPDA